MDEAVTTVDSASTSVGIPANGPERTEWLKTGELPEKKAPSKAESAPAKEAPPASEEGTASASEAEHTQEPRKSKRSNADTRLAEILEDLRNAGLSPAELKTFKKQAQLKAQKAEPQPATASEKTESKAPKKPKVDDFNTWEEYTEAHDKFVDELTEYKAQAAIEKAEAAKAQRKLQEEMQSAVDDARKRYSDYDEVIEPARLAIFENPKVHPAVKAMTEASPVFVDLLYVIGSKPDDMKRIGKLAETNPIEAIREIVLLDSLVREEKSGKVKEEPPKVPAKRVPTAPDPGYEVSGTNAAPGDSVLEAVKRGDFAKFAAEENRRDIARRKGR